MGGLHGTQHQGEGRSGVAPGRACIVLVGLVGRVGRTRGARLCGGHGAFPCFALEERRVISDPSTLSLPEQLGSCPQGHLCRLPPADKAGQRLAGVTFSTWPT